MSTIAAESTQRIFKVMNKIMERSADGDYIFRGESKCYKYVSSSLYRQYRDVEAEHFDIEIVQKEVLQEAKRHADESDKSNDFEILTQLQHYGGDTNLIDFSTDFHIALFFACDRHFNEDGRVILQQKEPIKDQLKEPHHPRNRVITQRSIFVQPPKGFIVPDVIIAIPQDLKQAMLDHLRKYHGISTATIYNDLYGFIINQRNHVSSYTEFYRGLTYQNKGNLDKAADHYIKATDLNPNYAVAYSNLGAVYRDNNKYDLAIKSCTKAIDLNSNLANPYINRGAAYAGKSEYDLAIKDFTKAIDLNPNYAEPYNNLGAVYRIRGEFDLAIEYFTKAVDLSPNLPQAYYNRGAAYADKGEFDLAIKDCTKAIDLNPNLAEPYNNLGAVYKIRGEFDLAIEYFTKAIDLNPNYAEAYYNRGAAYAGKGEFDLAKKDFDKATELKPNQGTSC